MIFEIFEILPYLKHYSYEAETLVQKFQQHKVGGWQRGGFLVRGGVCSQLRLVTMILQTTS